MPETAQFTAGCPISLLSRELLTKIFDFLVNDRDEGWRLKWISQTTHVCTQWRAIALSHAALWAHIDLDNSYDLCIAMFERSNNAPLQIKALSDHHRNSHLLFRHSGRIQTMELRFNESMRDASWDVVQFLSFSSDFPRLRELSIEGYDRGRIPGPDELCERQASNLVRIELRNVSFCHSATYTNLITLNLIHATPYGPSEDFVNCLRNMVKLEELWIWQDTEYRDFPSVNESLAPSPMPAPAQMPHLRKLTLSCRPPLSQYLWTRLLPPTHIDKLRVLSINSNYRRSHGPLLENYRLISEFRNFVLANTRGGRTFRHMSIENHYGSSINVVLSAQPRECCCWPPYVLAPANAARAYPVLSMNLTIPGYSDDDFVLVETVANILGPEHLRMLRSINLKMSAPLDNDVQDLSTRIRTLFADAVAVKHLHVVARDPFSAAFINALTPPADNSGTSATSASGAPTAKQAVLFPKLTHLFFNPNRSEARERERLALLEHELLKVDTARRQCAGNPGLRELFLYWRDLQPDVLKKLDALGVCVLMPLDDSVYGLDIPGPPTWEEAL